MRSVRLLTVAVLALVLAVSSAQNAFAATEIAYDNGTAWGGLAAGDFGGVRFTPPYTPASVVQVRFFWGVPDTVTVYITESDHVTVLSQFSVVVTVGGWQTVAVSGVTVCGDFYVVVHGADGSSYDEPYNPNTRSFCGPSLADLVTNVGHNLLIRAYVDPAQACPEEAVGGVVMSANTLALVAPWLAVIGLVGCIATVAVIVKKRGS